MINIGNKKFELDLKKVLPSHLLPVPKSKNNKTPNGTVSPAKTNRSTSQKSDEKVKEKDYYNVYVPVINLLENVEQEKEIFDQRLIKKMIAVPRPDPKSLGNKVLERDPWEFNLSVFKPYQPDHDALL